MPTRWPASEGPRHHSGTVRSGLLQTMARTCLQVVWTGGLMQGSFISYTTRSERPWTGLLTWAQPSVRKESCNPVL